MFCIGYYLPKRTFIMICDNDLIPLPLPSEDNKLIRKNFLHRMLFRDIY